MCCKFSKYDTDELKSCGEKFIQEFSKVVPRKGHAWTKDVREWFAKAEVPDGIVAYCHGSGQEYMVDFCHLKYPKRLAWEDRWPAAIKDGFAMKLAMECEWGSENTKANLAHVLEDAAKLALLRAAVKVMIFASNLQVQNSREEIMEQIKRLRCVTDDSAPWLCIDVPYRDPEKRHISYQIIAPHEPLSPIPELAFHPVD